MTAEPNAALIDAAALVTGLLVARHFLLAAFGRARWSRWASRWLRRGMIVAILIPALRLASLAMTESERAVLLWEAAVGILAGGALLLLLDAVLARCWRSVPDTY